MRRLEQMLRVVVFGVPPRFGTRKSKKLRAELLPILGDAAKHYSLFFVAEQGSEIDQGISVEIVGEFYLEHGEAIAEMVGKVFAARFPSTRIDCEVRQREPATIGYWYSGKETSK